MKQRTFSKKLVINKVTIANLSNEELAAVRGGDDGTAQGRTCEGTVHGRTCDTEVLAVGTAQGRTCEGTAQGRTCEGGE
jgi:hypothetical protein